jgi:succinyl-CoA synthetase beta subunit
LSEVEGLDLLADFGVPVVAHRAASSLTDVLVAAEEVGWPVALKTAQPGMAHKSDVGGVRLGAADRDALRSAYEDLSSRLGPAVTVAAMAPPGVELALGLVRDAQFGPLVLVAAGGVLVELLDDRRLAMPPVDEAAAVRMLDRLAVRPVLDGVRGSSRVDVEAVVRAIVALSSVATTLGDRIEAFDVNPLIAGPNGCLAVDALVIGR